MNNIHPHHFRIANARVERRLFAPLRFLTRPSIVALLSWVAAFQGAMGDEKGSHLASVDPFTEIGDGAAYKKLYEAKLFVTSANLARFTYLPANFGTERSVAVYQSTDKTGTLRHGYLATTTEASGKLIHCIPIQGSRESPVDERTIKVRRNDASLPASTAAIIHKVWLAMLVQTQGSSSAKTRIDSTYLIFSARDFKGGLVRAQANEIKGNTRALWEIGESLFTYCRLSVSERDKAARNLEHQCSVLLRHLNQTQ